MHSLIRKIPFYLCLFQAVLLYGQHPSYYQLTEKDGLPDVEFYDIAEDAKGFIWLAANKGLYRYDGKTFKNYTHPQKRGLSVFNLKFDYQGRLWCNNISGQFFLVENDSLHLVEDLKLQSKGQLLPFGFSGKKMIVTVEKKLFEIDLETKQRDVLYASEHSFLSEALITSNRILFEGNGVLLEQKLDRSGVDTLAIFQKGHYARVSLSQIAENDVLVQVLGNHASSLDFYLKTEEDFVKVSKQELPINFPVVKCFVDGDNIWFCTKEGIEYYTYAAGKFTYVASYFKAHEITEVLKDRNQNYWFTSTKNGVYVIPNIEVLTYSLPAELGNITSIEEFDRDHVILGNTKGNLLLANKSSDQTEILTFPSPQKVYELVAIDDENILASLDNTGFVINTKTRAIKNYQFKVTLSNAKGLSNIEAGKVVLGGFNYAEILDFKKQKNTRIGYRRAYTVHHNKHANTTYVGYVDGVEVYDKEYQPTSITYNDQPIFALDIDNTSNNAVWISTFKDGIIKVKNAEVVRNYTTDDGLLSNQTNVIQADGHFLWIVTDQGIQRLNTQTGRFRNLTRKHGIPSYNISELLVVEDFIYCASNKGVFKFNKTEVFKENKMPDVYFTSIEANGNKIPLEHTYAFSPDIKRIKINFHANGYLANSDVSYFYSLASEDTTWYQISEGVGEVVFNNLSAGHYQFQLKAKENNGSRETAPQTIDITIKPPVYKQGWFLLLSSLALVFLLWLYFSNRLKALKKKQHEALAKERLQQEMVASKLKSLQAQMNPHFVFNAMNSIQNLVLKNDKKAAYTYLTKFASLMRDNLLMSEKSFVYFDEEIAHLKKYLELEQLRFRDDFVYTIEGEEAIDDIKIPSTIIQPFVENAIKHGLLHKLEGTKTLHIAFALIHDTLKCTIIDNGVGIEKSKAIDLAQKLPRTSFSTKAIKEKLALFEKYYQTDIGFHYESVEEGTKVIIHIPAIATNEAN